MGAAFHRSGLRTLCYYTTSLIDFIWPPLCILCGTLSESRESLVCNECQDALEPHHFVCSRCGSPRPGDIQRGRAIPGGKAKGLCRDCFEKEPPFTQARSFGPHTPPLSHLIYHLKYRHKPHLAPFLSSLMARTALSAGWMDIDAVISVPTTRWRLWRRGYNQAELLAEHTADQLGLPLVKGVVVRLMGRSQVGYHSDERERNVQRAFSIRNYRKILHRNFVLIDDVYTTGATVRAMTRTLKSAGAKKVYILTLSSTGRYYSP